MTDVHDTDPRIAKLETHFEYIRRDLEKIEAALPLLASKQDVKDGQRETRNTIWIVGGILSGVVIGVASIAAAFIR